MFRVCLEPGPQTCPLLCWDLLHRTPSLRTPDDDGIRPGWDFDGGLQPSVTAPSASPPHPFFSVHFSVLYLPVSKPSFPDCLQAAARLFIPGFPLFTSPGCLVPSFRCCFAGGYQGKKSGVSDERTDGNEGETLPFFSG